MESRLEHFMCFPASPISHLSAAAQFASLPRRRRVYLGETVPVLLVLRSRCTGSTGSTGSPAAPPWEGPAGSLFALASVCDADSRQRSLGQDPRGSGSEEPGAEEPLGDSPHREPRFRACSPLLNKVSPAEGDQPGERSVLLLDDQAVFCLTVSLDKLPVNTRRAKVMVTVWRESATRGQLFEHDYLTLLQLQSPADTFHQDSCVFKTQVSTILDVLPPPSIHCQQITVSGKHLTVLKVLNCHAQEEVCVRDVKIFPDYNSSYLPMMPDGSVLVMDNVCHQSSEVTTASFCRIHSSCSRLPSMLSALEEQNFLFQLQLQDVVDEDSSEGLEMKLLAVLQWSTPSLPLTRYISTCYSLPSIWLERPRLVMMASCPRTVRPLETFWVKYTLMNDLQDFLAVRLMWTSEEGQEDPGEPAVVCRSPFNNLGQCRKGSSLSITLTFQILHSGLYELSRHMKMKLQFTASVSAPPSAPPPSSPAIGPLPGALHGAPNRRPSRSCSMVDDGESVQCPEHSAVPVRKIAKRECKVLVL